MIRPLVAVLHADRDARFWFCQLIGWLGWSVGTFLTITVVDGNVDWIHVGHIAMSAVLGVLATSPLRPIYQFTFESGLGHTVIGSSDIGHTFQRPLDGVAYSGICLVYG